MACLDMYNNSTSPPPMSPRISFSNDFVESHNSKHFSTSSTRSEAPASTDFEFSVSNHNMLSADELFSKGRLLPFKHSNNGTNNSHMQRTLRDELLLVDDDNENDIEFSLKPPKGSSSSTNRWKGFLGLRKSHIGSKKPERNDVSFDAVKNFAFASEDPNLTKIKSPQDMVSNEGPSSTDMEMGI